MFLIADSFPLGCEALLRLREHRTQREMLKNNQGLQYYIHDRSDALRLVLAGSLSGAGAQSIRQAWQTALSIIRDRPLIIDISFVVEADEHGRTLLCLWQQHGAQIIAASPESRALVYAVLGEPILVSPPKQSWLRRLRALLLGRSTIVELIPAQPANPHAVSPQTQDH